MSTPSVSGPTASGQSSDGSSVSGVGTYAWVWEQIQQMAENYLKQIGESDNGLGLTNNQLNLGQNVVNLIQQIESANESQGTTLAQQLIDAVQAFVKQNGTSAPILQTLEHLPSPLGGDMTAIINNKNVPSASQLEQDITNMPIQGQGAQAPAFDDMMNQLTQACANFSSQSQIQTSQNAFLIRQWTMLQQGINQLGSKQFRLLSDMLSRINQ